MARYLFVNRYFYPDNSATSQLLSDLAFALARKGHDVTVVASRDTYCGHATSLAPRELVDGVRVQRVWTTRFGRRRMLGRALDYASFYVFALFALLRLAGHGQVVIAKTDPPLISVVVALCVWLRGGMQVNWLQDLFPEVGTQLQVPGARRLEGPLVALRDMSLRSARLNVVLGGRMRDKLLEHGIPAERVRVLPNWAESNVHPLPHDDNALRAAWNFDHSRFVVGYSGNMGRAHDIETIVAAAIRLRGHDRIRFLFVGDGAKRALVERAVAEHGLANVELRPYQHRDVLASSLSVPDVHLVSLLPTLEGLIVPCKVYGALAAGRAIVNLGDVDGEVARLLRESGAGSTCASGDVDALCSTLERMCEDGSAVAMGEAAHAYSHSFLQRDMAVQRWIRALATVEHEHSADGGHGAPVATGEVLGAPLSN